MIVGYKVRHQVTGARSWSTTVQLTGTVLTTMIAGLDSGTGYTVQLQTRNGETPSFWSLDGTGSTGTTRVWSTTMTVGEHTDSTRGFSRNEAYGSMDSSSFTISSTTYRSGTTEHVGEHGR